MIGYSVAVGQLAMALPIDQDGSQAQEDPEI
jgi:hypothetical protein